MIKGFIIISLIVLMMFGNVQTEAQQTEIKIGGLFPLTGALARIGIDAAGATQMAVDIINATDSILSGYTLNVLVKDTQTNPNTGINAAQEVISDGAVGIIGAASSAVSKAIVQIAAQSKIPQISYSSSNPDLSDKVSFPYFMRLIPSGFITRYNAAVDYLTELNITEIAIIYDPILEFLQYTESQFAQNGINVTTSQEISFEQQDFSTELQAINESGTDFVIVSAIDEEAKKILTQLDDFGLQNKTWLLITDSKIMDFPYNEDGSLNEEIAKNIDKVQAIQDDFEIDPAFFDLWETCNGKDSTEYLGCGDRTPDYFAAFAFDTVFTFAYAIRKLIDEGNNYNDGDLLLQKLYGTNFVGMTGNVTFNDFGDRLSRLEIIEMDGTNPATIGTWTEDKGLSLLSTISKTEKTSVVQETTPSETTPELHVIIPFLPISIILVVAKRRRRSAKEKQILK